MKKEIAGFIAGAALAGSAVLATPKVDCDTAKIDLLMVGPQKDGSWSGRVNGSVKGPKGAVIEGGTQCAAKRLGDLEAVCLGEWRKAYCK
jgi:hypothetical protein